MKRLRFGLPPEFRNLWLGQTVSEFGSRISRAGIPLIAVITLAATPNQMGLLTAAASIPVLLFGLFAGVWVDRLRRRPILIAMDLARMALLLTIPAAALTGHLSIGLLFVIAPLLGVLGLMFQNAYHAYLPTLVNHDEIVEANSRLATTESLAEIGGPALAGVLIQAISAPLAVIFDAVTFLVSAASVALIRKPEPPRQPREERSSVWTEIGEGIRTVAANPILRTLALTLALRSFFGSFYGTLYDIFGIRDLGLTPGILGVAIAAGGVGALLGALLSSRITRRFGLGRTLIGSFVVSAIVGLMTPLAGGSTALATAMLIVPQIVGDGAMTIFWINSLSVQQIVVPNRLLGRTSASFGFLAEGIAPVGAVIAGLLATAFGARLTLLIAVLGSLVTAFWLFRSPLRSLTGDDLAQPDAETESAA